MANLIEERRRDRVFVQRHIGSSGPIRHVRALRAGDQRGLSLSRLQRRMRTVCANDPAHHGRGGRRGSRSDVQLWRLTSDRWRDPEIASSLKLQKIQSVAPSRGAISGLTMTLRVFPRLELL
jgi:hypothetical protein